MTSPVARLDSLLARARRRVLEEGLGGLLGHVWAKLWMRWAGPGPVGRLATRLAGTRLVYFGRHKLATMGRRGFVSPTARLGHELLVMGGNVFVGDRVVIYRDDGGGAVEIGEGVHLNDGTRIQTGLGGAVTIGADTHVQPSCHFAAYLADVRIGAGVDIAPRCAFYSYDHGFAPDRPIRDQELRSRGDITVGDGAWLGHGVIVLSGARIGRGSVVGAGSVVTRDVPDDAIAVGVPARVVGTRGAVAGEAAEWLPSVDRR